MDCFTDPVSNTKLLINLEGDPWAQCMDWKLKGRTIARHVGKGVLELDPSKLRLHTPLSFRDPQPFNALKVYKELKKERIPVLNACVLDYLLAHPELIPESWKQNENFSVRYIYFMDTFYQRLDNSIGVRFLYWRGGIWGCGLRFINEDWYYEDSIAFLEDYVRTPQILEKSHRNDKLYQFGGGHSYESLMNCFYDEPAP